MGMATTTDHGPLNDNPPRVIIDDEPDGILIRLGAVGVVVTAEAAFEIAATLKARAVQILLRRDLATLPERRRASFDD